MNVQIFLAGVDEAEVAELIGREEPGFWLVLDDMEAWRVVLEEIVIWKVHLYSLLGLCEVVMWFVCGAVVLQEGRSRCRRAVEVWSAQMF